MPYIDADYYTNVYGGVAINDPAELNSLISRASDLIDELTGLALVTAGGIDGYFSRYNPLVRSAMAGRVRNAVACEVEYLFCSGGAYVANDGAQSGGNVRIGNFSYTDSGQTASVHTGAYGRDTRFSQSVYSHLSETGLLFRGVGLCT